MYVHKLMELDQMIYASQILVDMKLFSEKYCLYPFHSTNNEWHTVLPCFYQYNILSNYLT